MIEMMVPLDSTSNEPLYVQLYQHIKHEIVNGKIAANTRLPSIRALAAHLHISRNTVELAYHQLIAEGYVQNKPRSGMFVIALQLEKLPTLPTRPVLSLEKRKEGQAPLRYDFRYGDVDAAHFPLSTWRKLTNECLQPEHAALFCYGNPQGEPELRHEISEYLYHSRGVNCSPEQIIIGAGSQYLLSQLCNLLRPVAGNALGMEEPGYDGVRTLFLHHGFEVHPIALEKDGLSVIQLDTTPSRIVYITPSHQFPYGMVMPLAKRMQLLAWAEEKDGIIIEDDYDSEFRYVGKPIPSLHSLDTNHRTVYLGTFSKCLLPSLRIAYMVLPPGLLELHRKQNQPFVDQSVSRIHQHTLALFMNKGHWEAHLRKMRNVYHKKQTALLGTIRQLMGEQTTVIGRAAGLHILLRVHNGMTEQELIAAAANENVRVYAVSPFWAQPNKADSAMVQIGFGGLSVEEIVAGVHALHQAWFKTK